MKLASHILKITIPQHILFAAGLVAMVLGYWSPLWLLVTWLGYVVLGYFGASIFIHRYWCHNSFKTWTPLAQFGAYCGSLCGIGTPIVMYSIHFPHHAYADTDRDPHTPVFRGRLWSWWTWQNQPYTSLGKLPPGSRKVVGDPVLRVLHRHYIPIYWATFVILALISLPFAIFFMIGGGLFYFHTEGFVNAYCHDNSNGYTNGDSGDSSVNHNSKLMMYLTLGNSLHHNHHLHPNRYSQQLRPGEFDLAHYLVPLLTKR